MMALVLVTSACYTPLCLAVSTDSPSAIPPPPSLLSHYHTWRWHLLPCAFGMSRISVMCVCWLLFFVALGGLFVALPAESCAAARIHQGASSSEEPASRNKSVTIHGLNGSTSSGASVIERITVRPDTTGLTREVDYMLPSIRWLLEISGISNSEELPQAILRITSSSAQAAQLLAQAPFCKLSTLSLQEQTVQTSEALQI